MGRRGPLLFGCVMYTMVDLGIVFASSVTGLMGLRFLQHRQLGGRGDRALRGPSDLFNEHESARMYSFLVLVMGFAPITAPLLGGQLLITFGWRSIFLVLAGFGLLCLLMVWFGLEESLPPSGAQRPGWAVPRLWRSAERQALHGLCAGGRAGIGGDVPYISGSAFVFMNSTACRRRILASTLAPTPFGLIAASAAQPPSAGTVHQHSSSSTLSVTAGASLLLFGATLRRHWRLPADAGAALYHDRQHGHRGPNATALAMAPYGRKAAAPPLCLAPRSSSAHWPVRSACSPTAPRCPMTGVIALCSVTAYVILRWVALNGRAQVSAH